MAYEPKRRVYLFGTGGTISFVGENRTDFANYSYRGQQLTIQEMLARAPEAEELAEVVTEQIINVGSTEVYPSHWLTLANRINERFAVDPEAAGAAVTHGTATLEETAYFLNLTVRDARPVVVTGAMRPPSAMGTDADNNLLDAVRVAAAPQSAGRGALVVLNNEIQSARDVTKTDSYRVETFQSGHMGFPGVRGRRRGGGLLPPGRSSGTRRNRSLTWRASTNCPRWTSPSAMPARGRRSSTRWWRPE